jgi:hypothetical protein
MIRTEERKRAAELKAVDVRGLITASLPMVLPQLTAAHIDQLQRILDVAVINADIEGRGDALDRQSIKGKIIHSDRYLRDPAIVAQRDKVLTQRIIIKPGDHIIRLDYRKLLTHDALKPTSDNPDEAAYLLVVAEAYEHHGVYLELYSSAAYMIRQMAPSDPRKWSVRLVLALKSGGGEIKTSTGSLDRNALLSVGRLSAGYYQWVSDGPTLKALESALVHVKYQIEKGLNEHMWWWDNRKEFPIVSKISDTFGGADWPAPDMWNQPRDIYLKAVKLSSNGKLTESGKFALLATYQTEWCARAVHEYAKATTKGASRVVTILEIVKVCGEIAGWILSLLAVGQGLIRLLSRKGGQAALQGGALRQLGGGQLQLPAGGEATPVSVSSRIPKSGGASGGGGSSGGVSSNARTEVQINMNHVRQHLGMPAVTQPGRLALAQEAQFERHLEQYMNYFESELKALKARNPKWTVDDVSAIVDRADKNFGGWLPGD